MQSSILNYFIDGVSETYNETVEYWSKDDSLSDAVDAVSWSLDNTDTVIEATEQGIDKSVDEFNTAVSQDSNKLLIILGSLATLYYFYKKGGK